MRRGVVGAGGRAALLKERGKREKMAALGDEIQQMNLRQAEQLVLSFQIQLATFAAKYRAKINSESTFRRDFSQMCLTIGVDPLRAAAAGEEMLLEDVDAAGGAGKDVGQIREPTTSLGEKLKSFFFKAPDRRSTSASKDATGVEEGTRRRSGSGKPEVYYSDLAVRILTSCLATRPANGGLLRMDELLRLLNTPARPRPVMRGSVGAGAAEAPPGGGTTSPTKSAADATEADVVRSVALLETSFGAGVSVKSLQSGLQVISSVPEELDADQNRALEFAASSGGVLQRSSPCFQHWSEGRVEKVFRFFLREGLCWLDVLPESEKDGAEENDNEQSSAGFCSEQTTNDRESYWFPALVMKAA